MPSLFKTRLQPGDVSSGRACGRQGTLSTLAAALAVVCRSPAGARIEGSRESGGIVGSLGGPGAAAEDAPGRSQRAGQGAVAGDRTLGVVAARRPEAAANAEGGHARRQRRLVEVNTAEQRAGARLPARRPRQVEAQRGGEQQRRDEPLETAAPARASGRSRQ